MSKVSPPPRLSTTPAGIRLGPLDLIEDRSARGFVIDLAAWRFHGFIVRKADTVFGYVDLCPHMSLPLAKILDQYLTPTSDLITCSWHDAVFEIASGRCAGAPRAGVGLTRWPVEVVDGQLLTRPDPSDD